MYKYLSLLLFLYTLGVSASKVTNRENEDLTDCSPFKISSAHRRGNQEQGFVFLCGFPRVYKKITSVNI